MSILGRIKEKRKINERRLQILETENTRLNEECSRLRTSLNQVTKENEELRRKYDELLSRAPSNNSSSANLELTRLKEKCDDYKHRLENANREIANYKQDLLTAQARLAKIEADYKKLEEKLNSEINNDIDNLNYDEDENDKVYHIRNIVKKNSYYLNKVYCSKSDFFHSFRKCAQSHEYEMYKLLLNIIYELKSEDLINAEGQNVRLSLFAQVRLADIVELQCSTFDKFKNDTYRKSICKMIKDNKSDFDNDDYQRAFLYPILSSHIDFLICLNEKTFCVPLLAIELHGEDHNEESQYADEKRIRNDKFKNSLFESGKVKIKLMVVKNAALDNTDDKQKTKDNIYQAIVNCLEKRKDILHIC